MNFCARTVSEMQDRLVPFEVYRLKNMNGFYRSLVHFMWYTGVKRPGTFHSYTTAVIPCPYGEV